MALYLYRECRSVGLIEQGILVKRYRAISSAPFADLTPQTVRHHYESLDVANESLPDSKRHDTVEIGETLLTTLLSTSEDVFYACKNRLQISVATIPGFTITGNTVKDCIIAELTERAQRDELLSTGTRGAANLSGSGSEAATDPSKAGTDKRYKYRGSDGKPQKWVELAGLCK